MLEVRAACPNTPRHFQVHKVCAVTLQGKHLCVTSFRKLRPLLHDVTEWQQLSTEREKEARSRWFYFFFSLLSVLVEARPPGIHTVLNRRRRCSFYCCLRDLF